MKTVTNSLSIIAIAISLSVAVFVYLNQKNDGTIEPSDNRDSIQVRHLAQALGYSWHPIIYEKKNEHSMLSLSISDTGAFEFQGGGTLPESQLYLFYRVIDSKIEYSIVGEGGGSSSGHALTNTALTARVSKNSGEPIKVNEIIMSMGEGEASLSPNTNIKQFQIALVTND